MSKLKKVILVFSILLVIVGCFRKKDDEEEIKKEKYAVASMNTSYEENTISYTVERKVTSETLTSSEVLPSEKISVIKKIYSDGSTKMISKRFDESGKLLDIVAATDYKVMIFDQNKKLLKTYNKKAEEKRINKILPLKLLKVADLNRKKSVSMKVGFDEIQKMTNKMGLNMKKEDDNDFHYTIREEAENYKMTVLYDALDEEIAGFSTIQKNGERYHETSVNMEYQEINGKKVLKKQTIVMEDRDSENHKEYSQEETEKMIKEELGEEDGVEIVFVEDGEPAEQIEENLEEEMIFVPEIGTRQNIIEEEYKDIKIGQQINEKLFKELGVE